MSALIVTATFGDGDNGWLQHLRRAHYPAERNQVPAHLTLFHQLPPTVGTELTQRLKAAVRAPRPAAMLTGILDLGGGTAFRVESSALAAIRGELAEAFHGLLTPQDQAPWRTHVTIQNKVAQKKARALQKRLREGFEPRPLAIRGLAAWRYLGGPWEQAGEWPFRL